MTAIGKDVLMQDMATFKSPKYGISPMVGEKIFDKGYKKVGSPLKNLYQTGSKRDSPV